MKRINEDTVTKAIYDLQDDVYERFGRDVEICIDNFGILYDDDEAISAKVAWASTEAQTPEDAEAFANKILEAVEMAKAFPYNGAVLRAEGDDEEGYDFWYEMEDEETEEDSEGMPIIPDDGPRDFWDIIMEREQADMEAFEQMQRERALRANWEQELPIYGI